MVAKQKDNLKEIFLRKREDIRSCGKRFLERNLFKKKGKKSHLVAKDSFKEIFLGKRGRYSLVRLVRPNTEELISRPLEGLLKIRLLFQDGMRSPEFRN